MICICPWCVGTHEAEQALRTDQQLANRFEARELSLCGCKCAAVAGGAVACLSCYRIQRADRIEAAVFKDPYIWSGGRRAECTVTTFVLAAADFMFCA
jgi:Bacterial TniB protein